MSPPTLVVIISISHAVFFACRSFSNLSLAPANSLSNPFLSAFTSFSLSALIFSVSSAARLRSARSSARSLSDSSLSFSALTSFIRTVFNSEIALLRFSSSSFANVWDFVNSARICPRDVSSFALEARLVSAVES